MQKLLLAVIVAALCGGCAHRDLKTPCTDKIASLNEVPCDDRLPVNLAALEFGWFGNEE